MEYVEKELCLTRCDARSVRSGFMRDFTDQMAEWYGASASGSVDLGFDSESGQTNDFKIGIHSFPA